MRVKDKRFSRCVKKQQSMLIMNGGVPLKLLSGISVCVMRPGSFQGFINTHSNKNTHTQNRPQCNQTECKHRQLNV